jgi:cation diffusion facilitator CzcD-associated flavoprotein CzcO
VVAATFNEAAKCWTIQTDRGDRVTARFCIMATGCLSAAKVPDYQGINAFRGKIYHTGHWPAEEVDFTGRKVGVIGTGSSAIQCIPQLARQASHLFVFQRTPNFSVPAHNGPLAPEVAWDWKANRARHRHRDRRSHFGIRIELNQKSALGVAPEERQREYETRWRDGGFAMLGAFADITLNKKANETAAEFVRSKIRAVVNDPVVAEKLVPVDYPFAAKRLCVDTDYYATFNRDNVTLIDVRATPIREITCTGVRTAEAEYALDSIVCATGFDAMTGALSNIDIRGRAGVSLKQHWSGGPCTYLGIMIAGFPNLFTITGPGSPSVLSNMVLSIEQHVEWISDCIGYLRNRQLASIEATVEAENAWVAHVNEMASYTLLPRANSWYMGANIPNKPRVFMPYVGGVGVYRHKCEVIAAHGYEGFTLRP